MSSAAGTNWPSSSQKIRQSEVRKMREENEQRERGKKQECGEADRPHHMELGTLS